MFVPVLVALPLGGLITFGWLIWAIHCLAKRRRTGWLAVIPALLTITIALTWLDVPLKVRFALSAGSFDRAVAAARSGDATNGQGPIQIGSYLIMSVQALPGNGIAFFESNGSGPFDDAGFAYLPTPPPAGYDGGLEAGRFRHLRGGWYAFTSSW